MSIGKLEEVIDQGVEFYKYVFIDESHRCKGDTTQRYEHLTRVCQGKGVILYHFPIEKTTATFGASVY